MVGQPDVAGRPGQVRLACYTTLRLGGPAGAFITATSAPGLVGAVSSADQAGEPLLMLGGGSNLVVADEGFLGTVVHVATRGVDVRPDRRDGRAVLLRAQAGENWDELVARCVAEGLAGVECLAGIPGLVGATPIQNVGAYGQEVAQTIVGVRAFDRRAGRVARLDGPRCGFGYRTSMFKRTPGRYVVLEATFRLDPERLSHPIRYPELASFLGIAVGGRAPLDEVRAAVLALRRGKGMVLDPADPDTRSAGSFFVNPVLGSARLAALEQAVRRRLGPAARYPAFPAPGGQVKVPAAWLIEHAGFGRGYAAWGAQISGKHTLALINPGGATTAGLLALARQIRSAVREAFGITLANEPILAGPLLPNVPL